MWSLNSLNDSVPLGFALACAAVMVVSWLLTKAVRKAGAKAKVIAMLLCLGIIGLVGLSVGIARTYPGPAWKYEAGTLIHWAHQHALPLGSYLALLIPLCAATLVVALRPQGGKWLSIAAVILSGLLIIPSLIIGLAVVCNHPGACP